MLIHLRLFAFTRFLGKILLYIPLLHPVHFQAFILGEEDCELALSVSYCDRSLNTTLLLITDTFFRSKNLKFHLILKT